MVIVDSIAATMVTCASAAAAAVATSPSGHASRWNAVGAMSTGIDMPWPNTVASSRGAPQPRRTRGTSARPRNAASLAATVTSSCAPLAK